MYKTKKVLSSTILCFLATAVLWEVIFLQVPPKTAWADTNTVLAWSGDWHHYCIDGSGYAPNTASTKNDRYMRVSTGEGLNSQERSILFWSMLSFMASYRHDPAAAGRIAAINQGAGAAGLRRIDRGVTEEDLKAVIHSPSVRGKYSWLDYAAAHEEEYLRLAGFLSGSAQTDGKGQAPALLQGATSLEKAVSAAALTGENGYVLDFDPGGRDSDFLEKVPIMLSSDGTNWSSGNVNGWNIQKSSTQIRITNPDPKAVPVYLKFDPSGTDYALSSGGFHSPDECYSSTLQVWKCVECSKTHATGGKTHPLENHQRTIWMELADMPSAAYYAALEKGKPEGTAGGGEIHFQIYRHEEDMEADYLVQLYKYDYETGAPLQGAVFDLYERFDDRDTVSRDMGGQGEICESGMGHTPTLWEGFRLVTSVRTDSEGRASYKLEKEYHYDKTFCDGHPAPVFGTGEEDESEEQDGSEAVYQEENDEGEYEEDIEEAGAANAELAEEWLECVRACEAQAQDGTHFHWIMEEVDRDAVESAASSGEALDCGAAQSADPERAYEASGCRRDCEETYKNFISMRYSYTFVEKAAREGYVLHGIHKDDVPVEIITTDASQNGANGVFGGGYSDSIKENHVKPSASEPVGSMGVPDRKDGVKTWIDYYGSMIQPRQFTAIAKQLIEYEGFSWLEDMFEDVWEDAPEKGTPSDAVREEQTAARASASNAKRRLAAPSVFSFSTAGRSWFMGGEKRSGESRLFENAYEQALNSASHGEEVIKGPADLYSHGGGKDGDEEAWRIYDHRTEGEIHINKRDMELQNRERNGYTSYGDTQGDAVLEGAVYGLFAADDLVHPDGVTGTVFRQNDLVAITAADKEGDASFMAITEAPGHTYDYKRGCTAVTGDGWNVAAPKNLYIKTAEIDDYTADGNYIRRYEDYETENGNCWIGRPLLLGHYYIKELSRSEGYELSVNGRQDPVSNYGYSLEVTIPRGEGSAAVTKAPYVELQSSGEEEDTMPNVINFAVTSQGTGDKGYDIELSVFPKGSRLYRKDISQRQQQVEAATGQKEKRYLFDAWGQPIYQRADRENTYPKRNPDGSFQTKEEAVNAVISSMGTARIKVLDEETAEEILENSFDGQDDREANRQPLALKGQDSRQFLYIKMKVEAVLRACGFETPKERAEADGDFKYSGRTEGIYNEGVRRGDTDHQGISGAAPGETAKKTVYGQPVVAVEIPKQRQDKSTTTAADAILSLLDFYGENPWYSFGGIHGYKESENGWQFYLYAGAEGNPADFVVPGGTDEEHVIYHRITWIPENRQESPRWIYVKYGNKPSETVFGTYRDFRSWQTLGQYRCSAVLVSDAMALGDKTIQSLTVLQNVYYDKGETLCSPDGSPLQAYEWVDVMTTVTQTQQVYTWTEIPLAEKGERLVGRSKGRYVDAYGAVQNDKQESLTAVYKLVLPRTEITLTEKDAEKFSPDCGYRAGDAVGYGEYMLWAMGAQVQVYLDYESQAMAGDGTYVKAASLAYPGQQYPFQDGTGRPGEGTRKNPIGVQQRVIGQSVKVAKSIDRQEADGDGPGEVMDNFRFKIYLKSNLERLFRDPEGNVVWMDRKGREIAPQETGRLYPALVPKLYTKVTHRSTPLYKNPLDSVTANKVLYSMEKGFISGKQNSGYTAVLETSSGRYNYEKFFDGISVANKDKWRDDAATFTSWRPLGNKVNTSQAAQENTAVSDRVRQFAIDWYLDQEIEKLVKAGDMANGEHTQGEEKSEGIGVKYSDQLYDEALWEAIKKAENYLKPFFAYDLDAIYAVKWDTDTDGGKDKDKTTLSADEKDAAWCFGVSAVLPYGTYVIVEQQPQYAQLEDLKNRHYTVDTPKEILVPAVYENYEGAIKQPEAMSGYYTYRREFSPEELAARFTIRFNQENHVIKAHNYFGDFQIYKYGLSAGAVTNGASHAGAGDYFALTQSRYKPLSNYYNEEDNRNTGKVPYYLTEGMSGREGVSGVYRYSSVSETGAGTVMAGALKAFEGTYAQALVPWSLASTDREETDMNPQPGGEGSYHGFAWKRFTDIPYKSRLRIEKLDSETHENLLHDGAVFRIYRAGRDESRYGTGETDTYKETTLITGSRQFLEGMGAWDITSVSRDVLGVGELYSGFVPAGTPVCREEDQVILYDGYGGMTGDFKAYTTTRDGAMEDVNENGPIWGNQNVGYLETPEELEAGAYVLAEIDPPAGYTRSRPVALEIYSDKIAYCKNGNPKNRVLATIYRRVWETARSMGNGAKDDAELARVYIENTPLKLKVEKKKNSQTSITYKVDGRVEGKLTEIGGNPAYEYAYSQGRYLGYGWKKGTLEYLKQQKDEGAQVEIVYRGGIFAGYGYVTVDRGKGGEENPYVAGAMMTLYEGLKLKPSGDKEDYGFEGLVIERSNLGNVTRMYVKEGWAGTHTEFLNKDGKAWDAVEVNRPDTDILYYDLGDLDVFTARQTEGVTLKYGYDIHHNPVELGQLEEDRNNIARTDREHSVFAFREGVPYLELTGGDFTQMSYDEGDKILSVPEGTLVYHVDRDGNRDALTDPHTGMAYVRTEGTGDVCVWPVSVTKDESGRKIGTDKITTSRTATVGEHKEAGYLTGSWQPDESEESHHMLTVIQNIRKENMDGEAVYHGNNGVFEKFLRIYADEHGLPEYFACSRAEYEQKTSLYDRDGDLVRQKSSDLLEAYEKASYLAKDFSGSDNGDKRIYHRFGESYLTENTWVTGEKSPNDPFKTVLTKGQPDILKRVPAGIYIMEELKAPEGYVKGFPAAVEVEETARIQTAQMEDDSTKVLIQKLDGTAGYQYKVLDMNRTESSGNHPETGTVQEGKANFGHGQVEGATLVLSEMEGQKKGEEVLVWETGKEPLYMEGLAQGLYLLEERRTPEGFVKADPVTVKIDSIGQMQMVKMLNDHTKVEFEKYTLDEGKRTLLAGAGFALYEAVIDEDGQYHRGQEVDTWESSDGNIYRGFVSAFEEMYRDYGTAGRKVLWNVDGHEYMAEYVSHQQIDASISGGEHSLFPTSADIRFRTDKGEEFRIVVYEQQDSRQGRDFVCEYQFDYKTLGNVNSRAVSYVTIDGMRRMDYLPVGKRYVLAELRPPQGYGTVPDKVITVEETVQVQRHSILNQDSSLLISKCVKDGQKELAGAYLALYRADEKGELIQSREYLAAEWVSGSDGVYTEEDWINGRIPEGCKKGDVKPHQLRRLPKGIYYLVEVKSPDFYTLMEPVKFTYEQNQQIQIIRAYNEIVRGELEILKTDKDGGLLKGAVFELTAYRGLDREPVFEKMVSAQDGNVRVLDLPVGEPAKDGTVVPYRYRLREITPPVGYSSEPRVYTFWFSPDDGEASWAGGRKAEVSIQAVNEKTRISIRKQDFDSPDQWVAGAKLAVYHVTGRDDKGRYMYDDEAPEATWVTGAEESYVLEGLTAGETYILAEKHAPEGYELMKPCAFTLSEDGRRICSVNGEMGAVTAYTCEESGAVRSVEVQGRYGIKVEMELRNEAGEMIASWTAGGDGHVFGEEDGIKEHEIFRLTETTVYSDGSREITGQTTGRCHLSENGTWKIPDRRTDRVQVKLAYEDGVEIDSWNPSELMPSMTVENPEAPESPKIIINGGQGAVKGTGLYQTDIVCTNTTHSPADMILSVQPGDEVTVIDPGEGRLEDGQIQYRFSQVKPGETRQVRYGSQLKAHAGEITVTASLTLAGKTMEERKTVPIMQKNKLTIFNEVTGTGKEAAKKDQWDFQVFLYTDKGRELKGSYVYEGSKSGSLRSGDILSLSANEYVTIDPGEIYRDIRYKVLDLQDNTLADGQAGHQTGGCASFLREAPDRALRTIFQKGQQYEISETTYYSDGSARESHKMRFLLDDQISIEGIAVMDRKQKVSVSKRDITGQEELEGALMQVRKTDNTILEEWVSGKEPHVLETVLVPGETYILREETAPAGYGLAEEIAFQIQEGGWVNTIIMEDQKTHGIFSKKAITGQEEIPGAVMRILDENGAVVEEWISGTEPYEIRGKLEAGKTYILHEERAPDGYGYGEDVSFTVALDGSTDRVEMRDTPTHVELSKTDITGDKELAGAEMEVLDEKGTVICRWVSTGEPYNLTGVLQAGGTYILRETAPPGGYAYGADVRFTVSEDGTVDRVVMKDEATRAEILKTDRRTGRALSGAGLELVTLDGAVAESWISTDEAHVLEGKLQAGQTYILREKKAPEGYQRNREDMRFTVPREAKSILVEMENERQPPAADTPGKPEEPGNNLKPEKTGKVYTDYWSLMAAHGKSSYETFTNLKLPGLGDSGRKGAALLWLGGAGALCFGAAVWIAGGGKSKLKGKFWILLCICFTLSMAAPAAAYGETAEVKPQGRLVVTGDVYQRESQLPEVLPETYYYNDEEYVRQSYQIVTAMTEAGAKEVEETVIYEEVEQADTLPETLDITVTDQRYGTEYKKAFPVTDVQFYNWRWVPGFELPITVEEADAQTYELNGIRIPAREEAPFLGYEKELLVLAQINPDYYRILEVTWTEDSWLGEDGEVYRNAVATGEKYVADCQAVYGGEAVFDPAEGVAWQAVYQKAVQETEGASDNREEEPWRLHALGTSAPEENRQQAELQNEPAGIYITLRQAVFTAGIVLFLLPALLIFIRKYQKAHKPLKK